MTMSGIMDVIEHPALVEAMQHLGFPTHILVLLGVAKLLAVAVLVAPGLRRAKEWAYAGLAIDLGGAIWSHVQAGDPQGKFAIIYVFLVLLTASHALRPASRRL